jgi:plastocyanin
MKAALNWPRAGRAKAAAAALTGLVLTGLALTGCGSSGGGPSAPAASAAKASQQVTIVGNSSLRFAPMTVHLHTGTVRITLKDSGAYPHNIVIPTLRETSSTVTGDPGGSQTSFTVTFSHPGKYPFHCQYHASAGMTGVFVVS